MSLRCRQSELGSTFRSTASENLKMAPAHLLGSTCSVCENTRLVVLQISDTILRVVFRLVNWLLLCIELFHFNLHDLPLMILAKPGSGIHFCRGTMNSREIRNTTGGVAPSTTEDFSVADEEISVADTHHTSRSGSSCPPNRGVQGFRAGIGIKKVARRTLGIILLLVTVVLWTGSNFLASVSTPYISH